jgi:hypothetical protein
MTRFTSAVRWQVFLRLPSATLVLAAFGFTCTVIVTLINYSVDLSDQIVPDASRLGRLGAYATALAIVPLVYSRWDHRAHASPFVLAPAILMQVFASTTPITATFVVVLLGWWCTRIRPAGAYSNPNHTATAIADQLQSEHPRTIAAPDVDSAPA